VGRHNKYKYIFELLFVNNQVFGLVKRLFLSIQYLLTGFVKMLITLCTKLVREVSNYIFALIRFLMNVSLSARHWIYSSIVEKRSNLLITDLIVSVLWVIFVIIKFIFSPIK
jgi:hypothetical protein